MKFIQIAGTKGKGSTSTYLANILTAAGYRCGLFVSPHIRRENERVSVDGRLIPDADLQRLLAQTTESGYFRKFYHVALAWFAERNTDLCVIECGMGGREDATNVFDAPLAAVITPVALDHTAWLGGTAEEIAAHKCGIIKAPCGVVTAPDQDPDALAVIWETAARQGLTVRQPGTGAAPLLEASLGRTVFAYGEKRYTLPLTGAFQRDNALTALETVDCLRDKGYTFTEEAVAAGLAGAYLPCRQEVLRPDPLVLADGAHNPHGVAALADTLRGTLAYNENRLRTLLFKLCVEVNMMGHTVAAHFRADPVNRRELRAFAVDEVLRTNGKIRFDDALDLQRQVYPDG